MFRNSRRFLCFALAAVMMAALIPAALSGNFARAEDTLGITIKDAVAFRVKGSMKGDMLFRVPLNTVCKVLGQTDAEGYTWYKVETVNPEFRNSPLYTGYLRGDCFRLLTAEEAYNYTGTDPVDAGVTPAPDDSTAAPAGTVGYITSGGVNFRAAPAGKILDSLNRGTQVTVLTIPKEINSGTWYKVSYNGQEGYIMSIFLSLDGTSPVITTAPSGGGSSGTNSDALGYVMTIKGSVNIRASIGGTSLTMVGKYETFPYLLEPVRRGNYTWYFVQVSATLKGYIRGDCVKVTKAPSGGGSSGGGGSSTVVTPTPKPGTDTPSGYVKTTVDYVNVRKGVWGDRITIVNKAGSIFPFYGTPIVQNGIKWYYIYSKDFPGTGFGYIHGGFVKETSSGGAVVTPTPTPTPAGSNTPAPTVKPGTPGTATEASYTTLKNGSSGKAVQNLVAELINQGYYKGALTSKYNSSVENAVRAFQAAKGLVVDGIAGNNTQHALFNTVPIGTADRSNLEMTLYPAEKIDWNTGGIQELWPRGANVKVYDVYTGLVWWAHRWSGGFHIDAEPLTAADTATICKIYGVSKASDIKESTHWQRRPCLITIGTRTFACSLYGVPHNPEGNTIKDNKFDGQLCFHFTNSKTHGGKKVDSLHMEAIDYAWKNAPNGHK